MSLRDAACYTLTLVPSLQDPKVLELVENYNGPSAGPRAQVLRFARVRETKEREVYSAAIHDYLSGARLASVGQETVKAKTRRLQLHGPDEDVSFEFTGKISFEWTFTFEGNKYRWNRSHGGEYVCAIDRKPDPKVEICLAKEADKKDPARLQILHYNIDRFPNEIKDLRGLETLLVTTFMSFLDDMDIRNQRSSPSPLPPVLAESSSKDVPPGPPGKPQKVISDEDFEPENPNEILVSMASPIDEHVSRAIWLLEDPHVLFIVIRTRAAEAAQRALDVSLGVTRFRHKEGLDELKQYVIEEEPAKPNPNMSSPTALGRGAPQPIKLDDPAPKPDKLSKPGPSSPPASGSIKRAKSTNWSAPNIAIYMSKIDLPDLAPGRRGLQKAKSNVEMGKTAQAPNLAHLPPPPIGSSSSLPPPPQGPSPPARPSSSPGHEGAKPPKTEGKKDSSWRNMMKAASGSR